MKHVRYLLLLLALMTGTAALAQFNPNNPDEPGAKPWHLTLKAVPVEAGYFNFNQQTIHTEGEQMRLVANTYNNYHFLQWEDEKGNFLSTEPNFNYIMPAEDVTLVARYEYNPSDPNEPGQASIKRRLTLKTYPEGAGRFNLNSNNDISTGEAINLWAYSNKNYYFRNWTQEGTIVSTSSNFAYTMPDHNVTLVANFDYDYLPDSPNEPGQATNTYYNIYGVRIEVKAGQTINYPLYLENRGTAVTGFQVDINLPRGFTTDVKTITLTDRATNHTLKAEQTSEELWHITVSGAQAIESESGSILTLPIHIPDTATVRQVFTIGLANGLVVKEGGEQQTVNVRNGSLKIARSGEEQPNSPDYVITDLQSTTAEVLPGGNIALAWQVKNQGNLAGLGGWTERIYLVALDGRKVYIGSSNYETNELQPEASVSRNATITLAQLPGIDGRADVAVTIVPNGNSGEVSDLLANNTAQTEGQPITIGKCLVLTVPNKEQTEGEVTNIRCQLARSGNWAQAESFKLTKLRGDDRILIPETVVIPREMASAYFYLTLTNDDKSNADSIVSLRVDGNGYDAVEGSFTVTDDELIPLSLTVSKSEVSEGETFQLTVALAQPVGKPLTVSLTTELPKRFRLPASVVIPAGQTKGTIDVTAIDNEIPDGDMSCSFNAYAVGYEPIETVIIIKDNDLPVLQLTLIPNKVAEGAGPVSVAGVLQRTGVTTNKITVRLSDDSNGGLYFGTRELVLNKGVEEISFNFGPIDNALVDGDRTYTITAAVWLSSCSCSAAGESAGSVSAQLQVLDDDGPALALSSTTSTIKEGGKATLTVSRNTTTSLEQPLTIYLSSDYDENLSYEHTVTIPVGQQTAQVEITSNKNDVSDDSHTVVFTVQADGFASGTCWLMVTDQTLPDAVITDFIISNGEVKAGGTLTVNVTVTNGGVAVLPKQTQIDFFISGSNTSVGTLHTHTDVAPGESIAMTKILRLPTVTGIRSLYCVVNNSMEVHELVYTNNTSNYLDIQLSSPYRATVACDKDVYLPGETISLTGKVEGNVNANSEVEIYLINDGSRQTLSAVTDSEGKFSLSYSPYEKQMGHFVIGACYPGEGIYTEQGAFDYMGLRRTSQKYISCEVLVGTPYHGTIEVENPTALSQHNIRAEVLSIPENCSISFSPVSEIGAGDKYSLNYTIEGAAAFEGTDFKNIIVRLKSDEGASTEVTLYCYCRLPEAQLVLDVTEINTTVTKGTPRDYPISITNNGAGETGRIMLSLPSLIQTTTSQSIASINPGETSTVILRLTTTEDMSLNVPYNGQIGINCENGNGITLPFSLLPVAEKKGTLIVDVCDEYTYYTEEAPHVKGAKVTVKYPYSDEIIATGTTDDNGMFEVELSEGYYALTVSADKHESYQSNLLIDPGKKNKKVVNLSYEGITVNWNVEEMEIEDEYEIKTTVTYETNVPIPVVVTELPDYIPVDSMAPGESRLFYAKLINKGLIAAEGVQLIFPETEYLTFEPLVEFPVKLLPQQSIVVPFKVTLSQDVVPEEDDDVASSRMAVPKKPRMWKIVCVADPRTVWFHWCGNDHQYHHYKTPIRLGFWKKCHIESIREDDDDDGEGGIPNGNGGFIWIGGGGSGGASVQEDKGCKTCIEILKEKVKDKLIEGIPIYGCIYTTSKCTKEAIDRSKNGDVKIPDYKIMKCETDILECTLLAGCDIASSETIIGPAICEGIHKIKVVLEVLEALTDLKECFWISLENAESRKVNTDSEVPSYVKEMDKCTSMLGKQINAFIEYNTELFGDESWLDVDYSELYVLLDALLAVGDKPVDETALNLYCPTNISHEQLVKFIYRFNNTFYGGKYEIGGQIDFDKISECLQIILTEEQYAESLGYLSVEDMWVSEFKKYKERLNEASNSVCASVTLQIEQTMTLTRPAYRGTLTVFNGHEDTPMENVRLNLVVKDEAGRIASEREFQMNAESFDGFGGEVSLTSNWTLEAQKTGKATVLFIPTKYAAPSEPVKYSFGGTLTYVDPFTGLEVTRDIFPVTTTVNPLPDLELTYLMQRDIYGDDPLTENVVEPMEPAEFALIINNKGYGEAKNVKMLTEQPKIIENEKDLLVNFEIVSSQVNGAPASLSFGQTIANDFGTIAPHSQSYAQWWIQSSLLGHFTSYEVAATHVTDYGNVHLSLIDTVTIHEMIHGFTPLTSSKRGFLVNDIVDADDLPDVVYFTDATQQPLYMAAGSINRLSNSEFMLTTTTKQPGWNYGSVADPTGGRLRLAQITRSSDGTILPLDNMWQTNRTLRDARDWLNENRLHFVALLPEGGESYLLTFKTQEEVGVKAVTDSDGLHVKLSPIPIGEWMYINGNFREARQVEVYDMRGVKRLHKAGVLPGQGVYMGALSAGLYYITVDTDKGVFRTKVLKR